MSNSSTIVLTVLVSGLALRAALDVTNISRSSRRMDPAYGLLFLGVGVFDLFVDVSDLWGLLMIVVSIWYLFRGVRARKSRNDASEN